MIVIVAVLSYFLNDSIQRGAKRTNNFKRNDKKTNEEDQEKKTSVNAYIVGSSHFISTMPAVLNIHYQIEIFIKLLSRQTP